MHSKLWLRQIARLVRARILRWRDRDEESHGLACQLRQSSAVVHDPLALLAQNRFADLPAVP